MSQMLYAVAPDLALRVTQFSRRIFLTRCGGCGRWQQAGLCLSCRENIVRVEGGAIGAYQNALRRAIHQMKYCGRPDLAWDLGKMLAERLNPVGTVVCIPLAADKRLKRGYNQAELLARVVAHRLELPVAPHWLVCAKACAPQHELDRAGRRRNVEGAFAAPYPLNGEPLILVDDVMTTGATLEAAEEVLRVAGAGEIQRAVAARTLLRG